MKRKITDDEIALIKAMLDRGMKNKDIQFFFNRPDRAVNSGRITGIANGTYSDSSAMAPATKEELNSFLEAYAEKQKNAGEGQRTAPKSNDPLNEDVLRGFFKQDGGGIWRLTVGESDEHECKAAYGSKHRGKWLSAVAALANNRGGYLFFGVHDKDSEKTGGHDKSYELLGMASTEFQDADPKDIVKHIKAVFDPTPRVRLGHGQIDGRTFGVIYVDPQQSKPVIARQSEGSGETREGDIFFRYPGSSERIKYSDLRSIMDERDANERSKIMPMVERLLAIGPERAFVADLSTGFLTDGARGIVIDEDLVEKLKFIKEGEFSELDGAPTLRLLGDISTLDTQKTSETFGALTEPVFFAEFLAGNAPPHPTEYIKWAVEGGHATWLPIFWLARLAGLDGKGLADFIDKCEAAAGRRRTFKRRALGKESAFRSPAGPIAALCAQMQAATPEGPEAANEAAKICQAIAGLKSMPSDRDALFKLILKCQDAARTNPSAMTHFRRAVCRLDELLYPLAE